MPKFRLAALLVVLLLPAQVTAQGGERDPKQAIEGFQRYLEKKPYHDWAFDELVDNAVAVNVLGDLVEEYTKRVEEEEDALAPRIVLARLLARTDKIDDALDLLKGVQDEDAPLHRLVGKLQLRAGRWKEAVEALDRAAESTEDAKELEDIHKERGKAHLAAGDREAATKAFLDLAALDPTSFHLHLEAASELAWHGLTEAALAEFERCDELAGDDTSKRCRVLSETGRLHERQSRGEEAVATYRRAIELMGRGNWLKRDLFERILAIHQRSGTFDALLATAREDAADATDLDAREFLARVLVVSAVATDDDAKKAGAMEEARRVLAAATADFPSDLALSRSLLDVLESIGDDEARIAEYQRILGEKPDELELYLELGRVFASSGKFEQAKRQWNKTLEKRLSDAGLCVRLAGFYALFDQIDDAVAMYERAIELDPREVRHYAELAAMLLVRGRPETVMDVLDRADAAARSEGGDAARLGEVASLWSEFGRADRARAALETALELAPADGQIKSRLADAMLREGDTDDAVRLLHELVTEADESGIRKSAVDRIVRVYRVEERTDELIAIERAAMEASPTAVAPRVVLGQIYVQERQPDLAVEILEGLIALGAESEDARKSLARLYEERGELDLALAQYEAIVEERPQTRRTYLKEIARIHLARYDQEKAFECYDEILRGAPDNASAFKEVAEAYDRLGLHDERLECLQQAVRLKPQDAEMRLELADAWRTMGEFARAREEVTEATRVALDEDVLGQARLKLYVLLGETGALEEEIATLRRRVDENPYDTEAPLVLTDIYVRELEYELALEMLDRLLTFQPKESKLLRERSRLLRLMERHHEAISSYEALLKLPDTDQYAVSLDYAEALIESGDVEHASNVLAGINDVRQVAQIYRRHDLFDQAIEVLEKGAAGAPNDDRLLLSLASVHEEVGDLEGARETLERLLALRGDSWRVLTRLCELTHEMGRKEDALAVAKRMFSLMRIEEVVDEEEEDPEEKNTNFWAQSSRGSYRWFNANQQYRERLSELQSLFREKGWLDEFVEIGEAEMRLQPTNSDLYYAVLREMRSLGEREEQARAMVRRLRDYHERTGRTPVGMTARDWTRRLQADEMSVYNGQSQLAESRVADLTEAVASGAADEDAYRELAQLYEVLQRDADVLATLEAGVAAHPDSVALNAGLGMTLEGEKRYDEAVEVFTRLVPLADASEWHELERERIEQGFARSKRNLLQGFPLHVQRRVDDETLRRLYDMTSNPSTYLDWSMGQVVSVPGARMRLARCLLKLDRKAEATAILRSLEPENEEQLGRWAELANLYYDEELYDEAVAIYERMLVLEKKLDAEPVLGHQRNWAWTIQGSVPNYGRILEKRGEILEAYTLLRTYGHTSEGELLLTTHEAFEEAEAHFREERERALEALDADTAEAAASALEKAWREASIRYADILQFEKKWDEVLAVYEETAARLDDDFDLREQIAALHVRAGRVDDAIATRYAIIEKKRELNRYVERNLVPEGRVLSPIDPEGESNEYDSFGGGIVYYSGFYGGRSSSNRRNDTGLFELQGDYMTILQLHLDRDEAKEAADVLARVAREDAMTFRWMSWEIMDFVQNYQLGKDALPIVRLLHSYDPDDDDTALEYGRCLIQTGRLEEARKVLQRIVNRGNRRYWTTTQAIEELDRLEARLGVTSTETVEDLAAAVEADPRNVRTRMNLARRLYRDRRFEEALEHGLAAEELAPHQAEVAQFVKDALTVLDRREELEARLTKQIDEEKDGQMKFQLAVRLADWKAERGETAEAIDALFDRVVEHRWGGSLQYAPSSWWMERGDLERGREVLEREIEAMGPDSNASMQARSRLASLDLFDGDPRRALEEILDDFDDATDHTARLAKFGAVAGTLRGMHDEAAARAAIAQLSGEWSEVRATVLELAALVAFGELDELETRIDALVQEKPSFLWLYPALVDLARQRGDLEAALAYLTRLRATGVASKSRFTGASIGYVSEAEALDAEIGSLLFALGREDEAREVWSGMVAEEEVDDKLQVLATLYEVHELWDDARGYFERLLDKQDGGEKVPTLRRLSEIAREQGDLDEAVRLARNAEILSGHSIEARMYLAGLRRDQGTLPAYFDELLAASEKDPNDDALAKVVVQLAIELERDDAAIATVERMVNKPDEAKALKPYLIHMKLLRGDEDGALDIYEDLLNGNVDEWQRQNYATQLARVLAKRGELDRATAVLKRAYSDPNGYEAVLAIAQQYKELEHWEDALADARKARALDPKGSGAVMLEAEMLGELGRDQEVVDVLFAAVEDPSLSQVWGTASTLVPKHAAELDELARLNAAYTEDPTDVDAARRLGLLRAWTWDAEGAVEPLERVLAANPYDHAALRQLGATYDYLERYADAERVLLRRIELLDRERTLAREEWTTDNDIRMAVSMLQNVYFKDGRVDAALELPEQRLGMRYRSVSPWSYSYTNNPFNNSYYVLNWLESHALHEEYVRKFRFLSVFDRWSTRNQHEVYLHRFRAGDESALDDIWEYVREPGRALVGATNSSSVTYYTTSQVDTGDPHVGAMLRLYDEAGRLDVLEARVRGELAVHPDDPVMRPLLLDVLRRQERWEDALVVAREDLEEEPDDAKRKETVANLLVELERWDEALPILQELYRERIADVPLERRSPYTAVRVGGGESKRGPLGEVRFAWAGSSVNPNSSSSFWYSSSNLDLDVDEQEKTIRRKLMVALAATGRTEDARSLETISQSMDILETWGTDARIMNLEAYAERGLAAEAERLVLASLEDDLGEGEEQRMFRALVGMYRELGDEAKRREWAERLRASMLEGIEETPSGAWGYVSLAKLELFEFEDAAAARAFLEQAPNRRPTMARRSLDAWLALADGNAASAYERFKEAEERARLEGTRVSDDLLFGLGFATAAVDGPEAAKPILRRALVQDRNSRHAKRAEELLQ